METPKRKPARFDLVWAGALIAVTLPAAARADYVSPDSIPQPPPVLASANGTLIPSQSDLVTNQYISRGLMFPYHPGVIGIGVSVLPIDSSAAVAHLGGVDVWAPAFWTVQEAAGAPSTGELEYFSGLKVQLVVPGGTTPTTATSVTVDVQHLPNALPLQLVALDRNGHVLGETTVSSGAAADGGQLLSLSTPNISSVQVIYDGVIAEDQPLDQVPWGVAGIGFTPSPAPEPCGLALASVGAFALAGWTWRRRRDSLACASGW